MQEKISSSTGLVTVHTYIVYGFYFSECSKSRNAHKVDIWS